MAIKIKKCITAYKTGNNESVKEDTLIDIAMHINDVQKGCAFIANKIIEAGINHDCTKIPTIDEFMEELKSGSDLRTGKWYPEHINNERHHFYSRDKCHDDINLIDVIEALVDCAMAARARLGHMTELSISPELLSKAFKNTVEMLDNEIMVEA